MELLTFSYDIEASDSERRILAGKIVPYGTEVGNTSAGKVIFAAGSIEIPSNKKIKLLDEHNPKAILGSAVSFNQQPEGIYAEFKIAKTARGDESLILAQDQLKTGFSVGVEPVETEIVKGSHILVTKGILREVSHVANPAFASAEISRVAASEEQAEEAVKTTTSESEKSVEDTTKETVAPEAVTETAPVEASRPTVTFSSVKEHVKPISSSEYLGASIKAAMGDEEARRMVLAADDSTSTNTGLTLPAHLTQFVTTTFSGRPAFEAVTRSGAVPQLSFTVPKMGTAPTVASTAEGGAPSETGMTSTYDTVTAAKYSGLNRVSFELLDFSNPAFETLLMQELRKGYEKATDNALIAAFTASGTAATGVAATAAGLQSFISTEAAAAYKGTGGDFANKLVASTDQWAAITGYADSTGRALYNAQGSTQNASGATSPVSVMGNVLGTDLIVDHNIATSGIVDESAFLVAPGSVYVWESPTTNLRVNVLTSGEVEINMYGYLAIYVAKGGAGVRRFNLA